MTITESQANELIGFRLDFVRPFKATNTAEFAFRAEGNQTRVTLRQEFPSAEARNEVVLKYGAIKGGQQHLARLAEFLQERAG